MFDMEQEIRLWRKTMLVRLPLQSDSVAELESHLRDAVQKHVQSGLTPQDAWAASLQQLGDPDAIAREYSKLPGQSAWCWLPAQIVFGALAVISLFLAYACSRAFVVRGDALLATHIWTVSVGYAAVFAVGSIAVWSILSRALRGWLTTETDVFLRTTRYITIVAQVLIVTGVVLGGIWLRLTLGRFWVFDLREIGGIALVAWNALALILLVRVRDERLPMRLGLAGNAVVAACWIGPMMLSMPGMLGFGGSPRAVTGSIKACILLTLLLGALTFIQPGRLRLRSSR